jgi:hypothetical protein
MSNRLEKAIQTLRSLPQSEQDRYADFLLAQIEEDRKWNSSSIKHADKLRKLADQAIADDQAGLAEERDPDGG